MTVDVEAVVTDHLSDDDDIAAIVGIRIGTRTPRATGEPWVRVTLLDDIPAPTSRALHLTMALVQIDCYAGDDHATAPAVANDLGRLVRAAIHTMPASTHDGATVTAGRGDLARIPDPDFDPARERMIVTATIHLHP